MTRFTPRLISTDNWNQLVFDFSQLRYSHLSNATCDFPDPKLINQLFHPWGWKPPSEYRLEKYLNPKSPTEKSIKLCQAYSNRAVNRILLHYSDPSRSLIKGESHKRKFCARHSISYEYIEYCSLVADYFEYMYPTLIDPKSWYSIAPFSSFVNVDAVTSVTAKKAIKKMNRRENMLASRFPSLLNATMVSKTIWDYLAFSDEYQDVMKEVVEYGDTVIKRKHGCQDTLKRFASNYSLRQCWFCGEFYLSPIIKNNNPSRYCSDEKCKSSHDAWVQALKRKGESPASLGL